MDCHVFYGSFCIYILGAVTGVATGHNFGWCKIHFTSMSFFRLYWPCYCTSFQPNFAPLYKECNGSFIECATYILQDGDHAGHRPTLWPCCIADADIIFLPCSMVSSFFCLFSYA